MSPADGVEAERQNFTGVQTSRTQALPIRPNGHMRRGQLEATLVRGFSFPTPLALLRIGKEI